MNNLALWKMENNDLASAEPLLRGALEVRKKALGPDHVEVAGTHDPAGRRADRDATL